jgi:hypothetical protein
MKYEKPELSVAGSATEIIQGGEKASQGLPDSPDSRTIGAYEADE